MENSKVKKIIITGTFGGLGTISDFYKDRLTITEKNMSYVIKYQVPHGETHTMSESWKYDFEEKYFKNIFSSLGENLEKASVNAQPLYFCDAIPSQVKLIFDDNNSISFDIGYNESKAICSILQETGIEPVPYPMCLK